MNVRYNLHVCLCFLAFYSILKVVPSMFIPHSPCTENSLFPCRKHPTRPGSIVCDNIHDLPTFVHIIRCNSKENTREVFIERSYIDYLPLFNLDFYGIFFLNVRNVTMLKLLEGNEMVKLKHLYLDNVAISGPWNWEPLGILTELVRFSVSNMAVRKLDESLASYLSDNLQSLILTSTGTESIGSNALQRFENLMYISVQNNEVRYLQRSMFPENCKIKYFLFGKNKISSLPEDIFHDMPNLRIVALQGNMMSEILETTFRPVMNSLKEVLLEGNPLKCSCKTLWLAKKFVPDIFQGECLAPKSQYGKQLKNLQPMDFRC